MRRVLPLLLAAAAALCAGVSCTAVPPPHPRAVENNEYCAQYMGAGNLEKAEVHCDLGLQFSPNWSDLWVNKGIIALKRGQTALAKELFIKALRLNQDQAQAYNNLGYIYLKDKQYGSAHDQFQRALKVNPDYLEARYNLALTFKEMGEKSAARKEYKTILAVNPNVADAHHDLGVMAFEDHAYDEAIVELAKAVELDPKFVDAWQALGSSYGEAGKYAEARDAYTACLEVDPNNIPCRNSITVVNRKAVLLDPTLKELKENEGKDSDLTSPASIFQRALLYRDKGLKPDEERYYKKCLKLDGRYAPCHYGLYLIYKEDRKDREATIACKNFLKFAVADEFPKEVEACEKYVSAATF